MSCRRGQKTPMQRLAEGVLRGIAAEARGIRLGAELRADREARGYKVFVDFEMPDVANGGSGRRVNGRWRGPWLRRSVQVETYHEAVREKRRLLRDRDRRNITIREMENPR